MAILCLREGHLGHGERQYADGCVIDALPLCQDSCRPDRAENQGGENTRDRSGPIRAGIQEQGRKTLASASVQRWPWRTRSSKKPWSTQPKRVDCALAFVARGRAMMAVCGPLGLARSNRHVRAHRSLDWQDRRKARTSAPDSALVQEIRGHIVDLPTYGYRRACVPINRQRREQGKPLVTHTITSILSWPRPACCYPR